jgi:hypothetical protein
VPRPGRCRIAVPAFEGLPTVLDEHLAMDPAGNGIVSDFMEGKAIAEAKG